MVEGSPATCLKTPSSTVEVPVADEVPSKGDQVEETRELSSLTTNEVQLLLHSLQLQQCMPVVISQAVDGPTLSNINSHNDLMEMGFQSIFAKAFFVDLQTFKVSGVSAELLNGMNSANVEVDAKVLEMDDILDPDAVECEFGGECEVDNLDLSPADTQCDCSSSYFSKHRKSRCAEVGKKVLCAAAVVGGMVLVAAVTHAATKSEMSSVAKEAIREAVQAKILTLEADFNQRVEKEVSIKTQIPLPASWQSPEGTQPMLVVLDPVGKEFNMAQSCFLKGFTMARVVKIERIENVELYKEYYHRRGVIAKHNGRNPNELLLKHGTRQTDPTSIWSSGPCTSTYGVDFRFCEDGFYGRGAYFAEDTSYSHNYAHRLASGHFQMFLCQVAAGKVEQKHNIDRNIRMPSPGFHSVRGPIRKLPNGALQHGIVVYENNQSFPTYLVTYSV